MTKYGEIKVKISLAEGLKSKSEYEDCKRVAKRETFLYGKYMMR